MAAAFLSLAQTNLKWKPLPFINPGTKRALKTEKSAIYFYRSLPEKTMSLSVKDLTVVEVRAIGRDKPARTQFTLSSEGKKSTYDLKQLAVSTQYIVYEPIRITLNPGVQNLELLSYDRNIYYRVFYPVEPVKKKVKPIPLKIISYAGTAKLLANSHNHLYYTFNAQKQLSFTITKGRKADLYIRAELTKKELPVLEISRNGEPYLKLELTLKRTKTYKTEGIEHLTIGKKVELPVQTANTTYELKGITSHTFLARPVILKQAK